VAWGAPYNAPMQSPLQSAPGPTSGPGDTFRGRPLWLWMMLPLVVSAATRGLWAPDEPRYAQVAHEVLSEPGLLVMRLCGEVYPDKPPLLFWLGALFGSLTGWSVFGLRLISLLATAGTALLVQRIAGRHFGPREARLAPALWIGTAMVTELGGRLQIDPLLTLLTTLALERLDPIHARRAGDERSAARRRVRVAGLAMGLGMLAKGPIAVAVPMMVWAAWQLRARFTQAERPRITLDPLAIGLAVLPIGLWVLGAILREPTLAGPLLFEQHAGRLDSGPGQDHWGPWYEHVLTLPLLMAPWTIVLFVALEASWRALGRRAQSKDPRAHDGFAQAFLWFAVLFVFFSAIGPKRNLYLLPAYPAAALLVAHLWGRWEARPRAPWPAATAPAFLVLLGLGISAAGLLSGALARRDPDLAADLATLGTVGEGLTWRLPLGALPLVLLGAAGLVALARGRTPAAIRATLLGWSLGAAALFALVFPGLDEVKSAESLAGRLESLHAEVIGDPDALVPCLGIKPEGLRFYSTLRTVSGAPPGIDELHLSVSLGLPEPGKGAIWQAVLLLAWQDVLGPDTFAVMARRDWEQVDAEVRGAFTVLAEDRLGSRELVVLVPAG